MLHIKDIWSTSLPFHSFQVWSTCNVGVKDPGSGKYVFKKGFAALIYRICWRCCSRNIVDIYFIFLTTISSYYSISLFFYNAFKTFWWNIVLRVYSGNFLIYCNLVTSGFIHKRMLSFTHPLYHWCFKVIREHNFGSESIYLKI